MSDIIQLLPDHVANQIAAGEVVQRPASVVKELLENAIDANATSIKLIVKDAGKTLIQVIDNGKGMSVTDARLSFERHATSKIKTADDLFALHTKGFRGEALASIAAIAHVELKTKEPNSEVGTLIKIEGSELVKQDVVATPTGSSIAVKNLFYNIPARRNFLKSNTVELRHIIDEFHRVALAHVDVSFVLHHNENELFNLPVSNIRQRIVNIFGGKTNEKLVPVEETTEVLKIKGFVAKPEFAKKTRGEQFFFVNDRFIKSSNLNHAVNSAFEGLLRSGTHASYFLYLNVDPKSIDINIHPTKTEIKFDDNQTLYAILRAAVKHSLGQFSIAPVLDFQHDNNLDTPYEFKNKPIAGIPNIEVDRSFNPFEVGLSDTPRAKKSNSEFKKATPPDWESLYVGLESKSNNSHIDIPQLEFESEVISPTIFDETSIEVKTNSFQLQAKYIIKSVKSGLLVIDQYRAHQRVLYETYLTQITVNESVSQQLLFPLSLDFSNNEIEILLNIKSQLEQSGFQFKALEANTVEISALPSTINQDQVQLVFEGLINDVENELTNSCFSQTDLIVKSLAKSLAIKAGNTLSLEEQENLVNSLFACKEPTVTPFGKKVFVTLQLDELDKKFN